MSAILTFLLPACQLSLFINCQKSSLYSALIFTILKQNIPLHPPQLPFLAQNMIKDNTSNEQIWKLI